LYKLGLGKELGLEISGEGLPKIKNPSDPSWSGVTLPWMSIGYETLMTPLQILTFYNAVANDGIMVRPQFVSHITRNGETIKTLQPHVINRAIASRESISMAKEMLESVVTEEGTASNLRFGSFPIAGKTGTAQIANSKYGYKYGQEVSYQASFVGYFPAKSPEYSCIVVVNGPSNDVYYGNQVAGPVFKEISDKVYAQRFDLIKEDKPEEKTEVAVAVPISRSGNKEDLKRVFAQLGVKTIDENKSGEWVSTKSQAQEVKLERRTIPGDKVPNVMGMSLRDGLYLLEKCGLEVEINGKGTIKKQSLPPGASINQVKRIKIELS
jgi:cell division protein FtsI (penicillin-binding protein 3)